MTYQRPTRNAGEKGMAILAAASIIAFLSIAALVVDYGMILANRTVLSKAVDAAALAGAQDLPDRDAATATAANFVALNAKKTPDPVPTVTFPADNIIRVQVGAPSSAFFSRVLGLTDFTVGAVAEATRIDPNVAIIIDRSGSMCEDSSPKAGANCPAVGPWEPFTTVQKIAKGFVDQFNGSPTLTLISFSTTAKLDVPLTNNRGVIKNAIDNLKPGGYTDISASVDQSISQLLLASGTRPNLIVLMTDGKPNTVNGKFVGDNAPAARNALLNAAQKAADKGITIHSINYGVQADNSLMEQVAKTAGGKFYYAPDNAGLKAVYTEIATRSYIRLTYIN